MKVILSNINSIESEYRDSFSKEIIELWKSRKLKGEIVEAVQNSKKLGYLLIEVRDDEVINRGMFIKGDMRGQGGAQLLLNYLHTKFSNKFIWTNISEGAFGIYEKFHYIVVGERKEYNQTVAYFSNGNETKEKLEYLKSKVYGK